MAEEQITLQSRVAIGDDVVSRELQGEAVILNLQSGTYFGLNPMGTRMWSLLQQHGSLLGAFEAIRQDYDVAPERLEGDLLSLVTELRAKGLIDLSPAQEGPPRRA